MWGCSVLTSRADLGRFTLLRTRDRHRIWYLVGPDSGAVAQYDETRSVYWSFFRPDDLAEFLAHGRGWWVEV